MEELFIIKIGGDTLNNPSTLDGCIETIAKSGKKVILIHGGGKKVTELAGKLGIGQQMVEGRRITSAETMDLCTMVYAGLINKNIVAKFAQNNASAVGLTGADFGCIRSKRRAVGAIDYGFVGDVHSVNAELFTKIVSGKSVPVVCSVTMGEHFELLNTNADTMAAEISKVMAAKFETKLIYCFEKNGVLTDINDENSVLSLITETDFDEMKNSGQISDGMIPKLTTAFNALEAGVKWVNIINSAALENCLNGENTGTTIQNSWSN